MKSRILLYAFLLWSVKCFGLDVKGIVINKRDKSGIAYVNIGIAGKNVGTVSDAMGGFVITIPENLGNDTLRFSCIGFIAQSIPIAQLRQMREVKIEMMEEVRELREVTISSKRIKKIRAGSNTTAKFFRSGLGPPDFGGEVGTKINIPRQGMLLDSVWFYLTDNTLEEVTLRLNIYPVKGNFPKPSLLTENVIIKIKGKRTGRIKVDLSHLNFKLSTDVIVTLELLDAGKQMKGSILLSQAPPYLEAMYYRQTSHDKIKSYRGGPMGIYFTGFKAED